MQEDLDLEVSLVLVQELQQELQEDLDLEVSLVLVQELQQESSDHLEFLDEEQEI